MTDLNYREAGLADAGMISALATRVWLETYADEGVNQAIAHYIGEELSTLKFQQIIGSDMHRALLCFCDNHLVGFAIVAFARGIPERQAIEAELDRLYVQKNFLRRGIGKALLDQSWDLALKAGFKALWLSVYAGNHNAIEFYRSNGLQPIGTRYFHLDGEQHLNHVFIRYSEAD